MKKQFFILVSIISLQASHNNALVRFSTESLKQQIQQCDTFTRGHFAEKMGTSLTKSLTNSEKAPLGVRMATLTSIDEYSQKFVYIPEPVKVDMADSMTKCLLHSQRSQPGVSRQLWQDELGSASADILATYAHTCSDKKSPEYSCLEHRFPGETLVMNTMSVFQEPDAFELRTEFSMQGGKSSLRVENSLREQIRQTMPLRTPHPCVELDRGTQCCTTHDIDQIRCTTRTTVQTLHRLQEDVQQSPSFQEALKEKFSIIDTTKHMLRKVFSVQQNPMTIRQSCMRFR